MKSLPFMTHYLEGQCIKTNNLFLRDSFDYFEIKEGLWVTFYEYFFKENIAFINENQIEVPGRYNLSFIKYLQNNNFENKLKLNGNRYFDINWSLFHPGQEVNANQFKNSNTLITCFSFEHSWLEKNQSLSKLTVDNPLRLLFSYGFEHHPLIKNSVINAEDKVLTLYEDFKKIKEGHSNGYLFKSRCQTILAEFFDGLTNNLKQINYSQKNKDLMMKLISYLEDNLYQDFPGILILSIVLNSSPTRIKTLFKNWYGNTILQWYRGKQMELALKKLRKDKVLVKEIAYKMGFSNASKFSLSFKKYHGFNPSEV
jgi:AraC-like DNA-binding protein